MVEAFIACRHALIHRGLEAAVAGFPRGVEDGVGHVGFAVALGEYEGADGFSAGPVLVEELGMDDAPGRVDLAMDAPHAHLFALGAAPDPAVGAAGPEIHLADGEGPAGRRGEPAPEEVGLGEG